MSEQNESSLGLVNAAAYHEAYKYQRRESNGVDFSEECEQSKRVWEDAAQAVAAAVSAPLLKRIEELEGENRFLSAWLENAMTPEQQAKFIEDRAIKLREGK